MKIILKLKNRAVALLALAIISAVLGDQVYGAERFETIQARPESLRIDLKKTAVLVVDMQNAYASAGGIFHRIGQDISGAVAVIENNRRIILAARGAGVKVIYLKMKLLPESGTENERVSPKSLKSSALAVLANRPRPKDRLMLRNAWNEEIVDGLKPQEGDILIEKTEYSGFRGTKLDEILKHQNIKYLLITGIATNGCVESTLRDAFSLDYWPILVSDGTNHVGPEFNRQAAIWNVEAFFGWVSNTNSVIKALSSE